MSIHSNIIGIPNTLSSAAQAQWRRAITKETADVVVKDLLPASATVTTVDQVALPTIAQVTAATSSLASVEERGPEEFAFLG